MARVTIDELKKMMETEKDMTSVMDATRRMMKMNCEALEKHNSISEKQLEAMEKHTETLKKNTEVMEKYIELMEKKKQSEEEKENEKEENRKRSISASSVLSDIVEIPLPPPLPPTPEPLVKKAKTEVVENRWSKTCSPWMNPPRIISSPISLNQQPPSVNPDCAPSSNLTPTNFLSLTNKFKMAFKNTKRGCIYCGEAKFTHISEQCTVLRDCVTRTSFMTMNFICLTCAEPRFRCSNPLNCRFASRMCDHCGGIHLNALCATKYPASSPFRF